MRIIVIGGDGYLGWPTAMYLSRQGHDVLVVDNFARRQADHELGTDSLIPIHPLHERVQAWHEVTEHHIEVEIGDVTDHEFIAPVVRSFQPDAIVHFGEQRCAPYSMIDRKHAVYTQVNRAEWVHGFSGGLSRESAGDSPRIWAPVLGERQSTVLSKIAEYVKADEITPVLPFPAQDPRRGDRLLVEYRELLFEAWAVEPRDIIYAAEGNPFDVYQQLCGLEQRYSAALKSLGTAKTVVSAHSSKLLSLGVLLAAYERKLSVPHVEPTGYIVNNGFQLDDEDGELFEIWLAGEAYEPN